MMNENNNTAPKLFWIITSIAIIWNLLGVTAFFMQITMSPETMATLPDNQQALYAAQPAWFKVAFAVAVFGGLGGSILLALRKCAATQVFVVSLCGLIAQNVYFYFLSNTFEVMGTFAMIVQGLIFAVAVALIFFSRDASAKGWIG